MNLDAPSSMDFDLFDTGGRCVLSEAFTGIPSGIRMLDIRAGHLLQGIYSYRIRINGRIITGKLVKQE